MTAKARIALTDDHPIVLAGLRNLILAESDLELVGEATNGLDALKLIREQRPDVAIVDISMPGLNGIVLSRRIAEEAPSVRILMLTLHEDRAYLKQALQAGARGYVLKRSAAENLIHAIRAVLVGGLYIDPAIANRMFDPNSARSRRRVLEAASAGAMTAKPATPELSERETEVLKLAALGFTNKEIARRLDVGVKSVETFKARGSEKLGLKTRAEIVRYAALQGWLADA